MDENIKGLTSKEVEERLKKYGYNEISVKEESTLQRIFRRFWGPIPWMIEVAGILSAVAHRWEDFTIIIIMLFINAFVDLYQESKALNAISVLKKKLAPKALVLRDGVFKQVLAKELVPDDIIKLKIGDIVPADVKLLGGSDFIQVDMSALTGESLPVNKRIYEEVYANAIVKQGEMLAQVTKTGINTYFGKTVGLVAKAQNEEKSHFQKMVLKVGNFLIIFTLIVISIIIAIALYRGENFFDILIFSLVLTISAIPVAMPAVLTVTMALGAGVLAKKQAIVSRLAAIEELAGMDILCSDKTGTLTQNRMSLAEPFVEKKYDEKTLMIYASLASKIENNDPIEKPIFEYINKNNLNKELLSHHKMVKFISFDPIRKRTEAIYEDGVVYVKGAPQIIINLSNQKEFDKKEAFQMVETYAEKGFRTLGVAYKKENEKEFHFVGLIPLFDPPREDSKESIELADSHGVEVKMVTGDNIAVAKYISSVLGIGEKIQNIKDLKGQNQKEFIYLSKILSEAIVKTMSNLNEDEVKEKVHSIVKEVKRELDETPMEVGSVKKHESEIIEIIEQANGFAEVLPEDKYFIVDKLQKADHIVGMTGDGVNDAPALKKADCGIAVSGATDAARAAADIVLLNPGLKVIIDAIAEARVIFERMKSYVIYRIAETVRIVLFMSLAILAFNFYPVTAIMIIILALLNDIPIMAIAYDNTKVDKNPVRWNFRDIFVMSSWLGIAGVLSSFTIFYITMVYLKVHPESLSFLPDVPSWINMKDNQSWLGFVQSIFFVKLVVAGHATIYNTRIGDFFFKKPWPSWTLFTASFVTAVIGTIIGVYGFNLMTPIGWKWAMFMWGYALSWFVFNDIIKVLVVKYYEKKYNEEVI